MAKILSISLILLAIIAITYGRSTEYKIDDIEFTNNPKTYEREDEAGFEASLHLNIGVNANSEDDNTSEGNTREGNTGEGNTGEGNTGEGNTGEGNTDGVENLQDELDKSNKKIAELETQLTSLKVTSSELKQQNIRCSNGLNQSNKVIADMKVQITNLNETQELLKNSITGGQSCQEILVRGQTRNGVYTITGTGTQFEAYCKEGYMVFQRRFDGSTDFNQNFQTYVNGFGNVTGEYWLGLEKLYQFTKTGKHKLRIDLVAYDGDTAYAIYEDFSIGVGPGYQLHIGKYSGTAGDSLRRHNNMKFTTVDNDADARSHSNCAEDFKGAFWYNNCHYVNINSFNYHDKTVARGMRWRSFKGGNPMKETTMMVL